MLTYFNNRILTNKEPEEIQKTLEKIQTETQNYRDRIAKCLNPTN